MLGEMARIEAICIAPEGSTAMQTLNEVEAIAGVGLSGDRYAKGTGFYSRRPTDPGAREVTLIEAETLDALRASGIELSATQHRRNLTVRGVRLPDLLGQRFTIGEVMLEGVKDCPPCVHLERLTDKQLLAALETSGGLRARIVVGGTIRVGDPVTSSVPELTR
jgi:MOSC domain-containing protein YiiM